MRQHRSLPAVIIFYYHLLARQLLLQPQSPEEAARRQHAITMIAATLFYLQMYYEFMRNPAAQRDAVPHWPALNLAQTIFVHRLQLAAINDGIVTATPMVTPEALSTLLSSANMITATILYLQLCGINLNLATLPDPHPRVGLSLSWLLAAVIFTEPVNSPIRTIMLTTFMRSCLEPPLSADAARAQGFQHLSSGHPAIAHACFLAAARLASPNGVAAMAPEVILATTALRSSTGPGLSSLERLQILRRAEEYLLATGNVELSEEISQAAVEMLTAVRRDIDQLEAELGDGADALLEYLGPR